MEKARDTDTLTNLANQSYCSSSINCHAHKSWTTFTQFKIKCKEIVESGITGHLAEKYHLIFVNGKEFLVDGNLLGRKVLQDFCERHILSS